MDQRRKKKLAEDLAAFRRSYGRKAPRGGEPNDRGYDRELEARIKRMRPEELDALLRDEVEDNELGEQDAETDASAEGHQ